jgi:hypothetical protein
MESDGSLPHSQSLPQVPVLSQMLTSPQLSCHLYGYQTWSVTQKEEHILKVFENSVKENISTYEVWSDRRIEKIT